MHHVTLDRARPDERHLHHEIVERPRLEAGQGVHLRAALDLEHADRIRPAEIVVDRLVGHVELPQVDRDAARLPDVLQAVLEHGENAEAEEVDLDESHEFQVVLLPLDHGAVGHGRGLDRHHRAQGLGGEHEAADVDGAVPRRLMQAVHHVGQRAHAPVPGVEARAREERGPADPGLAHGGGGIAALLVGVGRVGIVGRGTRDEGRGTRGIRASSHRAGVALDGVRAGGGFGAADHPAA